MTGGTYVDRSDTEFGSSRRAVRAPDARLRPLLYRNLYGFDLRGARFSSWLESPRAAVTLMIDLDGSISAGGAPLPTAWIGGLGESPTVVRLRGGDYASVDIELIPLGAYTILGRPLAELEGACAPLEDAFGAAGQREPPPGLATVERGGRNLRRMLEGRNIHATRWSDPTGKGRRGMREDSRLAAATNGGEP